MLTNDQQKDLEKAIAEYLLQKNYSESFKVFKEEAGVDEDKLKNNEKLLERKWLTILKLQSKILDLEKKLAVADEFISKSVRYMNVNGTDEKEKAGLTDKLTKPVIKLSKAYKGHKDSINSVALHPTEPVFATGSDDSTIRLFDYELQDQIKILKGHSHSVNCVQWTKDTLVSGSSDMSIKVWKSANKTNEVDFPEFYCFKTLIGHEHSISFVFNVVETDILVSCSRDKTLKLWDKTSGYCRKTVDDVHSEWVRCCDANEKYLVSTGNDMKVYVFELDKLLIFDKKSDSFPINVFDAHENFIEDIKIYQNPDKQNDKNLCVTASRDKTIGVWNYLNGSQLMEFRGHENWVKGIDIIEDSNLVVSVGEDKTIRIWDITKKKQVFVEKTAHDHFINTVQFHREFRVLLTGSVDKLTKVWKVANSTTQDFLDGMNGVHGSR